MMERSPEEIEKMLDEAFDNFARADADLGNILDQFREASDIRHEELIKALEALILVVQGLSKDVDKLMTWHNRMCDYVYSGATF